MLIGLTGRMGSGKDTAYRLLCEHPDTGLIIRKAFADPLKVSAARTLGFVGTNEECVKFCNNLKEKGSVAVIVENQEELITGREFLQLYGTEAHRDVFGYDFWVDAALAKGTEIPSSTIVVFTDVRFVNEAVRIRDCGGEVWEINRKSSNIGDSHSSEKRLPAALIDRVIYNNGTLEELQEQLINALFGAPHMRSITMRDYANQP